MRLRTLCVAAMLVAFVAPQLCAPIASQRLANNDRAVASHQDTPVHGFDPANLDKSCKPCDDFNKFANGGWVAHNHIPGAYPRWGNFNKLDEQNQQKLHEILEDAAQTGKAGNEKKIGDFYASGMDTARIEAAGVKPLAAELARIDKLNDLPSLQA